MYRSDLDLEWDRMFKGEICDCGHYRKDHPDDGPYNLNGLGHCIPDCKCEKFHQAEEQLTFKGVPIEFDNLV